MHVVRRADRTPSRFVRRGNGDILVQMARDRRVGFDIDTVSPNRPKCDMRHGNDRPVRPRRQNHFFCTNSTKMPKTVFIFYNIYLFSYKTGIGSQRTADTGGIDKPALRQQNPLERFGFALQDKRTVFRRKLRQRRRRFECRHLFIFVFVFRQMQQRRDTDECREKRTVKLERKEVGLFHQLPKRTAFGDLRGDKRPCRPAAARGNPFPVEQHDLFAALRQKMRRRTAVDTGTDHRRVVYQAIPFFV